MAGEDHGQDELEALQLDDCTEIEEFDNDNAYTVEEWNVFVMGRNQGARGRTPAQFEKICRVCFGACMTYDV